jgi:uncharacterized protein (UPF0333 family)
MMDEAAIEFAKFFYTFVFQGKSICDAYTMTKKMLTINPNKSEEFIKNVKLFKLLTKRDGEIVEEIECDDC